jgi:anti-anti-sigma factor
MDDQPQRPPGRLIDLGELTMSSERRGDVHTLSLFGALDVSTSEGVQDEFQRVESGDASAIVLDLSGVTFVDSIGVRTVLNAAAQSREDAKELKLVRGPEAVQQLFELAGVEDILPFTD